MPSTLKDKAAIVGLGYTDGWRHPDRSPLSMYVEASKHAMDDAGLTRDDIDGIITHPLDYMPSHGWVLPQWLAEQFGMRNVRYYDKMNSMGGSAVSCLAQAAMAIEHGLADVILVAYGENVSSLPYKLYTGMPQLWRSGPTNEPGLGGDALGVGGTSMYQFMTKRLMKEWDTGPEVWAEIAVATRRWANLNPRARFYERPLTREDYFASPVVADPFRINDYCTTSDSGRAFIVTSPERARSLKQRPVYLKGVGFQHPWYHIDRNFDPNLLSAKRATRAALEMADASLEDMDAFQIYDNFTALVDFTMITMGLYEPGQSREWVKSEKIGPGGTHPVNTGGGQAGDSYQMGFTPLMEAAAQVQGNAGQRQLATADLVLAASAGGAAGGMSGVAILGR